MASFLTGLLLATVLAVATLVALEGMQAEDVEAHHGLVVEDGAG